MKRGGPLRRRRPLARHTAIRHVNHARIRARRAVQYGPQAAVCHCSPCLVCGAWPSEAHHWPTRARGGTDRDCMPLCRVHHQAFHDLGVAEFCRRFRVDAVEAVQVMREVADGSRPPHSERCTSSSPCSACTNEAESANERWLEKFYGSDSPCTVQEHYEAAVRWKREND